MIAHSQACTRFHIVIALGLFTLFYFTLTFSKLNISTHIASLWTPSAKTTRLIVFGDSFSHTASSRNPAQGAKWVEVLCNELRCKEIENFSADAPRSSEFDRIGAAAANEFYGNTSFENELTINHLLPDFPAQLAAWYEKEKDRSDQDEELVVAIFFGLWDLWQFITLSLEEAKFAISCSIFEIFLQLSMLAGNDALPIKIVLPEIWDLTFLPRYTQHLEERSQSALDYANKQKKMIDLVAWWNGVLRTMALDFPWADIYMPDWNTWVLDQIRQEQMYELGMGRTRRPTIADVHNPCWQTLEKEGSNAAGEKSAGKRFWQCADPAQNLFWDDMHLGPTAHRAFGKQLAGLLRHGTFTNTEVRSRNITEEGQRPMQLVRYIPGISPASELATLSPPANIPFDITHVPINEGERRPVQGPPPVVAGRPSRAGGLNGSPSA